MPVHDDLPCGNLLLVLLWRQRGQEFLLRRIGKHQTRDQFGVAQRNQLREQGTPAMPGQDVAPPAARATAARSPTWAANVSGDAGSLAPMPARS